MFKRHFKSTLGPQDNDDEPHPTIAHLYAVKITETMNVLQAMVHYQRQLLNLYHAKTHQDPHYIHFSEQQWSKQITYGKLQGEAKLDKNSTLKIIQNMMTIPEETSYQERIWISR